MTVIERREAFEQAVTDILFALADWTDLPDGPSVDDAREAVMRELLAYCDPREAVDALRDLCQRILDAEQRSDERVYATLANMAATRLRELGGQ